MKTIDEIKSIINWNAIQIKEHTEHYIDEITEIFYKEAKEHNKTEINYTIENKDEKVFNGLLLNVTEKLEDMGFVVGINVTFKNYAVINISLE